MVDTETDGTLRVNVKTPGDLFEALDALHTQVLDNFSEAESAPYIDLLEVAMDRAQILSMAPLRRGA